MPRSSKTDTRASVLLRLQPELATSLRVAALRQQTTVQALLEAAAESVVTEADRGMARQILAGQAAEGPVRAGQG